MFFPPFEQVVKRTGIDAVMASYNEIDGIPSHSNKWLLDHVLRGEWSYKGAVVSDYYAIEQMAQIHKIAPDVAGAAKLALDAGVDIDLPVGAAYSTLPEALRRGDVTQAQIDKAVERVLTLKFNAGLFENPFADVREAVKSNGPEGVALARKAAERSLVLLKNDGTLPLALPSSGTKPKIAVIGASADVARLGGYYGIPRNKVSPLAGIRALVGTKADLIYSEGVKITENDDWWEDKVVLPTPAENRKRIAAAVDAARGRVELDDIERRAGGNAEALALADGEIDDALMPADDAAVEIDDVAGLDRAGLQAPDDVGVAPGRHEADVLAVLLVGDFAGRSAAPVRAPAAWSCRRAESAG